MTVHTMNPNQSLNSQTLSLMMTIRLKFTI